MLAGPPDGQPGAGHTEGNRPPGRGKEPRDVTAAACKYTQWATLFTVLS